MNSGGIYVHIPYCIKKCGYCDFNSYSDRAIWNMRGEYFEAVKREIELISEFAAGKSFDTVYFGGGTPTAVEHKFIIDIMSEIRKNFNICGDAEITIECNPGTASYLKLSELRNCGINRISIGLQSICDKTLKLLGRIHTLSDFEDCLVFAEEAGFKNISVDLMFGLPNQTPKEWEKTLEYVGNLNIDHISCYCLTIEEGTPFQYAELSLPNDDLNRELYDLCTEKLESFGFRRYEISNYARNNRISRHNIKYWQCDEYIGIGAGAASYVNSIRFNNKLNVSEYINSVKMTDTHDYERLFFKIGSEETLKNKLYENVIFLNKDDMMSEFMFLGLRMCRGVEKAEFYKRFGIETEEKFNAQLLKYKSMKALCDDGKRIYINPDMLYVSNTILSDFV